MSVEVFRYAGDKVADPIVQPLLDDASLVELGRFLMDQNAQQHSKITAAISYRGGLKLGDLISLPNPAQSSQMKAKLVGIALQFSSGMATQTLTLERPL